MVQVAPFSGQQATAACNHLRMSGCLLAQPLRCYSAHRFTLVYKQHGHPCWQSKSLEAEKQVRLASFASQGCTALCYTLCSIESDEGADSA